MKKLITRMGGYPLLACLLLGFICSAGPAISAEKNMSDADELLKSMSSYLGGTKNFSFNADIDLEIITTQGQKLQLSSFATTVVQRPEKINIQRKGMISDIGFVYDGNSLTVHEKNLNVFYQAEGTGTIDNAFTVFEMETGIVAPGIDLLIADPYYVLSDGIVDGAYIGISYINGVACHHLAFREDNVDWQLWVQTGDTPFPMKYVITSKWQTGAPQYEIRFRDWQVDPQIDDNLFSFSAPEGAVRLETITVNELGQFTFVEEGPQ
jgi:hypothetical protein